MTKQNKFYRSPLFIVGVVLLLLIVGISCGACYLFQTASKYNNEEAVVPPEVLLDVLPAFYDERKNKAIAYAEVAGLEAAEACRAKNYALMHSKMETCEAELIQGLGDNTPILFFAMTIHADFEESFARWDVVKKIDSKILAGLPDKPAYSRMRQSCRSSLESAFENLGDYPEALKMRLEDLAAAEKDNSLHKGQVLGCLAQLRYLYARFHVYDNALETCSRELRIVEAAPLPDGAKLSSSVRTAYLFSRRSEGTERKAWLLADAGRLNEAQSVFDKLISEQPKNSYYYSQRGYLKKHYSQNFAAAIADYSKGIELEEALKQKLSEDERSIDLENLYMRRAVALGLKHDYDAALIDMSKALSDRPYNFDFARRGQIYTQMGNSKLAQADYAKAMELNQKYQYGSDSENASILWLRGADFLKEKHYKQALADYENVIKYAPDDPRSYLGRASVFEALGESGKALVDYDIAIGRLVQFEPFHQEGKLLEQIPERPLRMALQIYQSRARLYDSLKKPAEASADRAKAKELQAKIEAVQCI